MAISNDFAGLAQTCTSRDDMDMEAPHTKVLVVDYDPDLRQLLADYLNRHGYDTLLAADANDLPERIMRYSPDLLVLDRMLPSGDGADACRRLR